MDTAVTAWGRAGFNNYNISGAPNVREFNGVVRVFELPGPTLSVVVALSGHQMLDPRKPYVKSYGSGKTLKLLYGRDLPSVFKHLTGKRAVLASIPLHGFRHGFVIVQYVPAVSAGCAVVTLLTRAYMLAIDRVPPERRVGEAVTAVLSAVARRVGVQGVAEGVAHGVLRPALGREDTVGEVSMWGRKVKVNVWFLRNLPPLPHVHFAKLPLKQEVKSNGGRGRG